ncbi:FAS1 domain-containing protein [Lepidopterella palustris CBS 459.81]|uniref:FAS1 domain-containing protein n=1 Tax=Lepidopterella palustris CBS 459.81 TaxID=1314670 RepID=A0A8E2JHC9_9PEZI|nr:FAS1 domain-containing protein [Lepidopterella palustris CBS 459.81]
MMYLSFPLLILSYALSAHAQSLLDAISTYPQLSDFASFYQNNQALASLVFSNSSNYPITVLVPSNTAFATYKQQYGVELTSLSVEQLAPLVQYHVLVGALNKDNLTHSSGTTVPTLLNGEQFNNRTVGNQLAAKFGGVSKAEGQVVFISGPQASTKRLLVRQGGAGASNGVRSGLGSTVNMTIVEEGTWDGGNFHIIDGLLTPPAPCSTTIRTASLFSLDNALNRTNLWPALDHSPNVTCLGPSNSAFAAAGNADATLNTTVLTTALLFHTLPLPLYSDFLVDGQEFTSLSNDTVRVTVKGNDIWFNNAKVVNANVLTNNGLMHVLDSVMTPLNTTNPTSSATATQKSTATSSKTTAAAATSSGAAMIHVSTAERLGVVGLLSVLLYFF